MNWQLALVIAVAQTGHRRFEQLCADDHPDHEYWRADMIRRAKGEPMPAPKYPSIAAQTGNAIAAIARAAKAVVTNMPILVSDEERQSRQTICDACPEWDLGQKRCKQCGCFQQKISLATEACPLGKWSAVTSPPAS